MVIVNQAGGRREWPGRDPIGKAVYGVGRGEAQVIGLIDDVRETSLEDRADVQAYLPLTQVDPEGCELVVRSRLPIDVIQPAVMSVLRSLNPGQPRTEFRPVQRIVDHAVSPRRFLMLPVTAFAAFGLVLAALGIYGVISYSVNLQARQIGIRMALGASAGKVQRDVVAQTALPAGGPLTPDVIRAPSTTVEFFGASEIAGAPAATVT